MNVLPITIVGNLTEDPQLRFTNSGDAVCRITVAHNPRQFDRQANEWRDGEPTFFDCSGWRGLAEHMAESLKRGHRVIVYGNLRTQRWESDGTGKTPAGEKLSRQVIDIVAVGPELTFANAEVRKMARGRNGEVAPDDPWASASRQRPATVLHGGDNLDEPPF